MLHQEDAVCAAGFELGTSATVTGVVCPEQSSTLQPCCPFSTLLMAWQIDFSPMCSLSKVRSGYGTLALAGARLEDATVTESSAGMKRRAAPVLSFILCLQPLRGFYSIRCLLFAPLSHTVHLSVHLWPLPRLISSPLPQLVKEKLDECTPREAGTSWSSLSLSPSSLPLFVISEECPFLKENAFHPEIPSCIFLPGNLGIDLLIGCQIRASWCLPLHLTLCKRTF